MNTYTRTIQAALNARRYDLLLGGVEVDLNGPAPRSELRVTSVVRANRAKGYRFSKYAINAKAKFGSLYAQGRGEDDCQMLAVQKAMSEACERVVYRAIRATRPEIQNSNGWAAHIDSTKMRDAACFEILERDAPLVHWYTMTPFLRVSPTDYPKWLRNWVRYELAHSVFESLKLFISTEGFIPTVSTVFLDRRGHGVVSHAHASQLSEAIKRALDETCRMAQLASEKRLHAESISYLNGNSKQNYQPSIHSLIYAYHLPFPKWISGHEISWNEANLYWKRRMEKSCFSLPKIEVTEYVTKPISIGYAKSEGIQNLNFGHPNKTHLCQSRLEIIGNYQYNRQPHFVS